MGLNARWILELWRFRELFYFLAWRDVKVRYKQTLLGVVWAVLQPLATMLIFVVLFGKIANLPTDGTPHALFYYSALVPWIYFSGTLGMCGNSLVSNANLLTKVYFPRIILPASTALSGLVDFGIGATLIIGILAYYRIMPDWHILLWPFLVLTLVALTCGMGMILAALTVRYRDVKYATPFMIQLGLFATPIIYPASAIPDQYRKFLALNPLTGIIEAFRASLMPSREMQWGLLGMSVLITFIIVTIGMVYFRKAEESFADLV
jgi:lipopolysaccharide transport system permease protein